MKCLIINGSPSVSYTWNGAASTSFTAKLVSEVTETMSRLGSVEFHEIRLMEVNLPYCLGCYACFSKGEDKCPHFKLIQPVMRQIEEADCVILTSPVYSLSISALVKGFFDHTSYIYHRPRFFEKKALVISSTAGSAAKSNCRYMSDTLKHWGFNRVYKLPVIRMGANEVTGKTKTQCQAAAKKLYDDTASGRLHSPTYKQVFYFQLWRRINASKTAFAADRTYWQENGLDKHEYLSTVKLSPDKKLLGKALNKLFQAAFK